MLVGVEGVKPSAWGRSPQTPLLQFRLGYLEGVYSLEGYRVYTVVPSGEWEIF
jgi:hypothetical protein